MALKVVESDKALVAYVDLLNAGRLARPQIDKKTGEFKPASGNRTIATSGGNREVCGGLKFSLNLYDEVKGREVLTAADLAPLDGQTVLMGTNCTGVIHGSFLIVTMDPGQDHGLSGGGKSTRVATSHGNQPIGLGLRCGINLYDPIA